MADIRRIPFTEMFERVKDELLRDGATDSITERKYKGYINNIYQYDIPTQIDWRDIRERGSITTTNDWSTGYITDASSTTLTGDSDALWTSANSNTMLIKIGGYNELFRCTYVSATSLTIDRTWIGTAISSDEVSYRLFQDRYALASDFGRMVLDPDKAVFYWEAGAKVYLKYMNVDDFEAIQTDTVGDPAHYTIKWVDGAPYMYVDPPADDARTMHYDYIPSLARMVEYTTGTITTLANAGTAVTGSGTDFDGFVSDTTNYDYYLRIDSDGIGSASSWYKISAAASDTSITLSDAYEGTAISSGTSKYTISKVSLLPAGLDLAIVYGAAMIGATDQDSQNQIKIFAGLYGQIMNAYRAIESKKNYGKQRVHSVYEKRGVRR